LDGHLRKASFFKRILALAIDYVILTMLLVGGFFLVFWNNILHASVRVEFVFIGIILVAFICLCFKDILGASLGKWAMGLSVRTNDLSNQKRPPPHRLIIRNVFTFIWLLELLVVLCSSDRRQNR
jgi:uncharacterized RDD family membrane protein YckC